MMNIKNVYENRSRVQSPKMLKDDMSNVYNFQQRLLIALHSNDMIVEHESFVLNNQD